MGEKREHRDGGGDFEKEKGGIRGNRTKKGRRGERGF